MQQKTLSVNQNSNLFSKKLLADAYLTDFVEQSDASVANKLSSQLVGSYESLEQRVNDLTSELASVSAQRLIELTEKERLANRLEILIQSLPGGVIVLDSSGMIVESNPTAEALLECDLRQQQWRDVISRCFIPQKDDGHEVSNKQGQRISIITRSLGRDGQIILLTDQTQTRRLQADLSRNERLSALGKVVSTLAHQIRTPLSSAILYVSHLCDSALNTEQRGQFSHKLKNRLEFMERQVSDMLLFVKGDITLNDELQLIQLEQSLLEHIEPQMTLYNARYQLHVDKKDCAIKCHHDALLGAILNLVTNSLQASPQPHLKIDIKVKETLLVISITDNGPGIAPENLKKVKELFFTSKEQGTGIGLSVVNHVAKSHGGRFVLSNSVEAKPFAGLFAELYLPIVFN